MHQVPSIPNNNADFAFEKAEPKTLEKILKNLQQQENEYLKESAKILEENRLSGIKSYNESVNSFFQNFQYVNPNFLLNQHHQQQQQPYGTKFPTYQQHYCFDYSKYFPQHINQNNFPITSTPIPLKNVSTPKQHLPSKTNIMVKNQAYLPIKNHLIDQEVNKKLNIIQNHILKSKNHTNLEYKNPNVLPVIKNKLSNPSIAPITNHASYNRNKTNVNNAHRDQHIENENKKMVAINDGIKKNALPNIPLKLKPNKESIVSSVSLTAPNNKKKQNSLKNQSVKSVTSVKNIKETEFVDKSTMPIKTTARSTNNPSLTYEVKSENIYSSNQTINKKQAQPNIYSTLYDYGAYESQDPKRNSLKNQFINSVTSVKNVKENIPIIKSDCVDKSVMDVVPLNSVSRTNIYSTLKAKAKNEDSNQNQIYSNIYSNNLNNYQAIENTKLKQNQSKNNLNKSVSNAKIIKESIPVLNSGFSNCKMMPINIISNTNNPSLKYEVKPESIYSSKQIIDQNQNNIYDCAVYDSYENLGATSSEIEGIFCCDANQNKIVQNFAEAIHLNTENMLNEINIESIKKEIHAFASSQNNLTNNPILTLETYTNYLNAHATEIETKNNDKHQPMIINQNKVPVLNGILKNNNLNNTKSKQLQSTHKLNFNQEVQVPYPKAPSHQHLNQQVQIQHLQEKPFNQKIETHMKEIYNELLSSNRKKYNSNSAFQKPLKDLIYNDFANQPSCDICAKKDLVQAASSLVNERFLNERTKIENNSNYCENSEISLQAKNYFKDMINKRIDAINSTDQLFGYLVVDLNKFKEAEMNKNRQIAENEFYMNFNEAEKVLMNNVPVCHLNNNFNSYPKKLIQVYS